MGVNSHEVNLREPRKARRGRELARAFRAFDIKCQGNEHASSALFVVLEKYQSEIICLGELFQGPFVQAV